jgi:hypothetical protein
MWKWFRALKERRRLAHTPPRIDLRPDGFVVASPDGREFPVRWASVIRVLAYKSDHFTTDEVVVAFRQREDPERVFEISEEWPGFRDLFAPMQSELGVSDAWYLESIGRPFATDFQVIFQRESDAGGDREAAG